MLRATVPNTPLYMGKQAGKEILEKLESARSSIRVVTPYISADFAGLLAERVQAGLSVKLVVSTDMGRDKALSIQQLINQTVHVDYPALHCKQKGMELMTLIMWGVGVLLVLGVYFGFGWSWALLLAYPYLLGKKKDYSKIRTKTYSYFPAVDTTFPLSPFHNGFDRDHTLVHSKFFIIDGEVAYTGSINFTKQAFFHNHETRIKITDKLVLAKLNEEFDYLHSGRAFPCMDLVNMARFVYREPQY